MALLHYQFEARHTFADRNGKTGRILLLLYLKLSGLLDIPNIYLSEYIIKHKVAYSKRLKAVTEKDEWEEYILYILDMIELTSINGLNRINQITTTIEKTAEEITTN